MSKTGIGIIGAGVISAIYLKNLTTRWQHVRVIGVADLLAERAAARAEEAAGHFAAVRDALPGATLELATPILMRVIGGALSSAAKEMASVLFRMAYSSIIRESEDLGAGLFDKDGNVLAESDSTPMFMGSMPKIVKGVISVLGDDIHEGDVILHNDPYLGATHSPDVAVIQPIFHPVTAKVLPAEEIEIVRSCAPGSVAGGRWAGPKVRCS